MIAYCDSSALLRRILGQPGQLAEWDSFEGMVASRLLEVECRRVLDRFRLERVDRRVLDGRRSALAAALGAIEMIEVTPVLLRRAAEPFESPLGTLDAIHLVSALAWSEAKGERLVMATHDSALAGAARAYGLTVAGVS